MKKIVYKNYSITLNNTTGIYTARKGRKVMNSHKSLELLKSCLDAWDRNVECSRRIDAFVPRPSVNPNAGPIDR